ncbi:MAG: TolC family protein [Phycisphaerales bacterium]|jgi:outer membrane protein TolC|nr:TolC family protein [Phycisphaerales bacterium]
MRPFPSLRPLVGPVFASASLALVLAAGGCSAPSPLTGELEIRRAVVEAAARELAASADQTKLRQPDPQPGPEVLGIDKSRMPELESMAGPGAYDTSRDALAMPPDLLGMPQRTVSISLERAIRSATERNLEVQFARLAPAISGAQLVSAQAAFDWVFFSNLQWSSTDEPRQGNTFGGADSDSRQSVQSTTGLRKPLDTGGTFLLQHELTYLDVQTPGTEASVVPDPSSAVALVAQLDQPLLRNFGSDVALAQVRLQRNAEREQIESLRSDLIRTITDTETAYWELWRAHRDLLILRKNLARGEQTYQQVLGRRNLDATDAQTADSRASVEQRRSNVLRAQNALKQASNRLKVLINDPRLTIGDEVLLVPVDSPISDPIEFSLPEVMVDAVTSRPEINQALLSIDDTSIRQQVAASGRLPQLDLRLQARLATLEEDAWNAYDEVWDSNFTSYLVGLFFEQPIGNRASEAQYRIRRLERMQAVISYRNTVQQVLLEAKNALDSVVLNHELISQTTVARVAASEVLRALLVEKDLIRGFTIERLNLELTRQDSLAQREREEVQAMADYATAIAQLYRSTGRSLERNRINFVVPDPDEVFRVSGMGWTDDGGAPDTGSPATESDPAPASPTPEAHAPESPAEVPPADANNPA